MWAIHLSYSLTKTSKELLYEWGKYFCVERSHQERSLGVFGALDAQRVELALL